MHLADSTQKTRLAIHAKGGEKILDYTIEQHTLATMENVLQSRRQFRIIQQLLVHLERFPVCAATTLLAQIPLTSLYMQIAGNILANHLSSAVAKGARQKGQITQRILIVRQAQLVEINWKERAIV